MHGFFTRGLALVLVFLVSGTSPAPAVEWHHPLYLSHGGWWRQRIRVKVHNGTEQPLLGRPVAIPVGEEPGQAALVGARSEAVRVCDAQGVEMLLRITGPEGEKIETGPISAGSEVVVPVECAPKSAAVYYLYFDNPRAGLTPDFLSHHARPINGNVEAGAGAIRLEVDRPERIRLEQRGADPDSWFDEDPDDEMQWNYRAAARVLNFSDQSNAETLVLVNLGMLAARSRCAMNPGSIRVVCDGKPVPYFQFEDTLLIAGGAPPKTAQTYYIYFSSDPRIEAPEGSDYAALVASRYNRLRNPSFDDGEAMPDAWACSLGPDPKEQGIFAGRVKEAPEGMGPWSVRLEVPRDASSTWRGWTQKVVIRPEASYLVASWIKCEEIRPGRGDAFDPQGGNVPGHIRAHLHFHKKSGEYSEFDPMRSVSPTLEGRAPWTLLSGTFLAPRDAAGLQVHLTMDTTGVLQHDGAVVAEVVPAMSEPVESLTSRKRSGLRIWPVDAVRKVFREDLDPEQPDEAAISLARNEREALQLALRGSKPVEAMRVEVEPPVGPGGARLEEVAIRVVGYVPIDYPTNYYHATSPAWHRKQPRTEPGSDGWAGQWPDPLLPRDTFDLEADRTQAVWVMVGTGKDTPAGDYAGKVRFLAGGRRVAEVPFTVHIWDFTLPDENHVKAIYDIRFGPAGLKWWGDDEAEVRRELLRFLDERRLCPDVVHPSPKIEYQDGQVKADFTEFDKAGEFYFDELNIPHSYTPWSFYLFGWGHPPSKKFGQSPYPGDYPFEGTDFSRLRPEYKKAYQSCLKAYWDHVKEKGWDKRITLYISDEPFFTKENIRKQMRALCEMIHEVDPAIPIYSSTWHHVPAWDGYIDVWGIGHHGLVLPEKIREIRRGGARVWFTTDGQMCTDTPYCAVERLLPHYCFHYGAEAYEFWGVSWLTHDPYRFGSHAFIHQTMEPGKSIWVRYPNGDGYLIYPGRPIGHDGPVSSIRLEQAREGVEDHEYLCLLRNLMAKAKAEGKDTRQAEAALEQAATLVTIPNAGGRYSSKILPHPEKLSAARKAVAEAIEALSTKD